MTAVEVRDVVVRFGDRRVVDGVDLDVQPGRWLGLIGPNGAGKTTLLHVLAGLQRHASGWVRVAGLDPRRARPRAVARQVAVVAQRPVLPAGMPVFDYVLLGRTAHLSALRRETRRDVAIVSDVVHELGLDHLAGRAVHTLSGGEAQRAALARAIAQQAPVLLLDEPTSALDVGHTQGVLELVDRLRRDRGLTVVSAMHDLTSAGLFADELAMVATGRLVASGPATEVLDEHTIAEHYGARVRVVTDRDGRRVVVPVRHPGGDEEAS